MDAEVSKVRAEDFPIAVGHALGYLLAIAAVPPLAAGLPANKSAAVYVALLGVVVVLRAYLSSAVCDALSPLRATAILNRVDQAAILLFLASGCTVFALNALHSSAVHAALYAVAALAALGASIWRLARARHTVSSSSFLSIFD